MTATDRDNLKRLATLLCPLKKRLETQLSRGDIVLAEHVVEYPYVILLERTNIKDFMMLLGVLCPKI